MDERCRGVDSHVRKFNEWEANHWCRKTVPSDRHHFSLPLPFTNQYRQWTWTDKNYSVIHVTMTTFDYSRPFCILIQYLMVKIGSTWFSSSPFTRSSLSFSFPLDSIRDEEESFSGGIEKDEPRWTSRSNVRVHKDGFYSLDLQDWPVLSSSHSKCCSC